MTHDGTAGATRTLRSIAAVIATYEPGDNLRVQRDALTADGVTVYVVDDATPSDAGRALLDEVAARGTRVLRKPTNSGIGTSLNLGVAAALDDGHDAVLTFDQDSTTPDGYVAAAVAHLEQLLSDGARPGLVAPASNSGEAVRGLATTPEGRTTVMFPIQSGCLYPADALRTTGTFREPFVMDAIDHDYALRLRAHGYEIYAVPGLDLSHQLGDPDHRTWRGQPVVVSNHSATRQYYQFRNRVVLLREYLRKDPSWARELAIAHVRETRRILFFEKHRARKAWTILTASVAGLLGRTGPRR